MQGTMEPASVLIGVLPVLLVTALVLCYVCVLRRLCCEAAPRRGAVGQACSSTGCGGGAGVGPGGSAAGGGGAATSNASRTSVWCWWADGAGAAGAHGHHEELQLTNTTGAFDSQAPAS